MGFSLYSITKLTQLPSDITSNLSNNTIEKNKIIDKIVNSIINIYGLNDNAEYIKDVFDAHKFIYGGNIIFCKSESELESVIKSCLADYNYKLAIAYGSNDRISAGITIAENNISIILSVTKLDNGQIISIE